MIKWSTFKKVVVLAILSLFLLSGSAGAAFSSTASYRTNAPGDLILSHEDRLFLWEKDVAMVSRECGENRTLLKEGYLFLYDNVTDNHKESKRSANFFLYKNGEIVTQSNVKEGDFFYYNKTIDGNEYTIIKFKVNDIYSADGLCGGYLAQIQPFFQYSDGTGGQEIQIGNSGLSPLEEWNRTFTGAGNAAANSVQQTADGGYILAGATYNQNQYNTWLVKTDALGNEQWNRTFNDSDTARSVQQTADGGYIFVGRSLIKTDASGHEQWNRTYNGIGTLDSVQQTSDGGYIGAGYILEEPGSDHPDGWLIKVDGDGNEQWNRSFWGGGFGWIKSVLQTKDGGYALAGLKGEYGALLIKVDEVGNEQWNWTFGEWNRTAANSVVQANDGGYLLVGTMDVQTGPLLVGTMDLAAMFAKIDENGSMQWYKTRKFKGKVAAVPNSVQRTSDRGYIIAVEAHSYGGINKDSWLIKTDENGNEQWNMTFGGELDDEAFSVQQTGDGEYIVAGTTSFGDGKSYAWLRKVGEEQTETATPTASPTETPIAIQTLRAVPPETSKIIPTEKTAGFEVILAITVLLAVYIIGRKRR